MFYTFSQNNSGGSFEYSRDAGIGQYVIIEADSAEQANSRALALGLYFNGVDDGIDCECCGDRWYEAWESNGCDEPTLYGQPVEKFLAGPYGGWFDGDPQVAIHYANGGVELLNAPKR